VIIDKDYGAITDIELGSVIAFRHDGRVIVHRLIEIKENPSGHQLQTKGDANATADAWTVKDSDLIGIVRWHMPYIGWPTVWLDQVF
jgi:signal peptidase